MQNTFPTRSILVTETYTPLVFHVQFCINLRELFTQTLIYSFESQRCESVELSVIQSLSIETLNEEIIPKNNRNILVNLLTIKYTDHYLELKNRVIEECRGVTKELHHYSYNLLNYNKVYDVMLLAVLYAKYVAVPDYISTAIFEKLGMIPYTQYQKQGMPDDIADQLAESVTLDWHQKYLYV